MTILETNIQKERPLHGDLFSVNQVFSMTTIMCGNFFYMDCDVDYSTAHILSCLVAGLNDKSCQFYYCLLPFQKNLFLKESPKIVVVWV
jgi:hypothetical protein